MGPRILSRGNEVHSHLVGYADTRFNGAADFKPRKFACSIGVNLVLPALQWGRGF